MGTDSTISQPYSRPVFAADQHVPDRAINDDDEVTATPVTPMNKALQDKLQSLEEIRTKEEKANSLRNDVFRKQRYHNAHSPATQPVTSAAGRRNKNKPTASADTVVTDDVFVVSTHRVPDEDGPSAGSRISQTPTKTETSNPVPVPVPVPVPASVFVGSSTREQPGSSRRPRLRSESSAGSEHAAAAIASALRRQSETTAEPYMSGNSNVVSSAEDSAPTRIDTGSVRGVGLQTTSESQPASVARLPDGWEQVRTADGTVYYYHKVTRVSRFLLFALYIL